MRNMLLEMRGSIQQKGPDRWQVRLSLGRAPNTGRNLYVHGGRREAQRFAAKLVTEVERGEHRETGQMTV